jgi:DNA-binding GntR family transcriptional regulator
MAAKLETVSILPIRFKIASVIRKAILSGEYKEGEELSLTATAEQLGVSRTPVREAFQMLAAEDLIELRLNKGAIVRGISEKTIRDHFDIRMLLEGECALRAARRGMDLTELWEAQKQMEAAGGKFQAEDFRKYNQMLHACIWQAADNKKIAAVATSLWNGSSFGKTVTESAHCAKSIEEHRQILECIEKHDGPGARDAMNAHLMRSMNNIIDSFHVE